MGKPSDQFRQSDVTFWGLAALACAALAVLSANIAGMLPESVLGALHAPRIAGSSLGSLRAQVASLQQEQARLRRENTELINRFTLNEKASGEMTQRVGALEVSLPTLLEALPPGAEVDRSAVTASIGSEQAAAPAAGGSVSVSVSPLPGSAELGEAQRQPMPSDTSQAIASTQAYAVAIGRPVAPEGARGFWEDLLIKVGPLLVGLEPRLSGPETATQRTIIAGPLDTIAAATTLCQRLERVSISCLPVPFSGGEMPLQ